MADINKLMEEIGKLTMQEAADMGKLMEDKWGINYEAILNANSAPVAAEANPDATKSITLKGYGEGKKILAIKAVRVLLGLGLLESKNFCEALPKVIDGSCDSNRLEEIKSALAPAQAEFDIK